MTPVARWSARTDADGFRVELGPPGFVGFYRIGLAAALLGGTMVLPLALLGLFGAVFWADFGVAVRLLMGVVGAGATLVTIWLPIRLVTRATAWRARIRVRPGGVFVEAGFSAPGATWWLTPRADVKVGKPQTDELGRGGFVLSHGDQQLRLAVGHTPKDSERLIEALQRALAKFSTDPGEALAPPSEPLGPGLNARLRALGRDLLRPLLRPTPFLLVDLGAMILTPLTAWLTTEMLDWRDAYPIAFALFLLGLAARRFDGSYMAGLRQYHADDPFTGGWGFKYTLAGVAVAIAGWAAMTPRLGVWPAFALGMVATIGLHRALLRRARDDAPTPTPSRALDLALALTLIPICVLHEAGLLTYLVDSSRGLGPLALCFVPHLVLFGYLPVRMHAFIDDPDDRSNIAWFWVTVAWLALQPLFTIIPAALREL